LVATEIFDHAAAGDVLARTILNKSAQTLAYAIYNLAVVLNCPLFVLGGSVGMHSVFWHATQEILEQRDKRVQPKLLRSTLGADAQVNGAVYLAIEAAGSRVLSS
jgi:glucokinase